MLLFIGLTILAALLFGPVGFGVMIGGFVLFWTLYFLAVALADFFAVIWTIVRGMGEVSVELVQWLTRKPRPRKPRPATRKSVMGLFRVDRDGMVRDR